MSDASANPASFAVVFMGFLLCLSKADTKETEQLDGYSRSFFYFAAFLPRSRNQLLFRVC